MRRLSATKGLLFIVLWLSGLAASAQAPFGWRQIASPGPVLGADGQIHETTCSGLPGTNPEFKFWVKPGRSQNLVVYFEGGGACWDDLSCSLPIQSALPSLPQFFMPSIRRGSGPRRLDGLFNLRRADNPVRNWTVVYVPYCTGDIHIGAATRTYNKAGILPLPETFDIQHRGFSNFMVVLDWITRNVPAPEALLVTGASAGGYGASANFPWLARQFPQARLAVLADGSQGVTTETFDTSTPGRGSWNPQLAPWVFGEDPAAVPGPELLRIAAQGFPRARFAQYTNVADAVQVEFYAYSKLAYGPGGSCPDDTADWNGQMLDALSSYQATLANFRSYLAPGIDHTILRSERFYEDQGTGVRFADWLASMLGDDQANWSNVACPDCMTRLPCP